MGPNTPPRNKHITKLKLLAWWCQFIGACSVMVVTWPIVYCWRYWQGWRLRARVDHDTLRSLARTYDRHTYEVIEAFAKTFYGGDFHFTYVRLPCWNPGARNTVITSGLLKIIIITAA